MNLKAICSGALAAAVIGGTVAITAPANAQGWLNNQINHRQQTKNNWRNLAIGAGALGALGFVTHNDTLGVAGLAGGLYSLSRMNADQRSENRMQRARARFYSRPYTYRNGVRYHRRTVWSHGHRYYQFVRG